MSLIHSSKIKEGLLKCLEYSRRLISGADELQKRNEDATAVCLAIIAQEEIGKTIFLLRHMKNKEDVTCTEWEKYSKGRDAHINKLREFREFFKKLPKKRH
jgi:AbiV family abortive infection protein